MFVRNSAGIGKLEALINKGEAKDLFKRLSEMESRYLKQCPDCGNRFWITHDLLKTSWFDGEAEGYKCPQKKCSGFVKEAK
jgi:hypothetical protein